MKMMSITLTIIRMSGNIYAVKRWVAEREHIKKM